jgi:hypothetical protein
LLKRQKEQQQQQNNLIICCFLYLLHSCQDKLPWKLQQSLQLNDTFCCKNNENNLKYDVLHNSYIVLVEKYTFSSCVSAHCVLKWLNWRLLSIQNDKLQTIKETQRIKSADFVLALYCVVRILLYSINNQIALRYNIVIQLPVQNFC